MGVAQVAPPHATARRRSARGPAHGGGGRGARAPSRPTPSPPRERQCRGEEHVRHDGAASATPFVAARARRAGRARAPTRDCRARGHGRARGSPRSGSVASGATSPASARDRRARRRRRTARLTDARSGAARDDVTAEASPRRRAPRRARARPGPRRERARRRRAVPDRVSLLDLLELPTRRRRIAERWWRPGARARRADRRDGRRAVHVDPGRDGPHALIAGMTGAGKSELLQTLVASLAAAHPPNRLTFLLVDYKGGAAFKDCVAAAAHGRLRDRPRRPPRRARAGLAARRAARRERILREAGASDLAEHGRARAAARAAGLVIVVDEFATLASEVPEFVDGVVDVAQRGRTLGLHLVLATQRPRGAVSDNIRANTNLRIALRVNDAAESTDVIEAPDAARIPRVAPGRAFALTGHGELHELQTAYVGSPPAARAAASRRSRCATSLRRAGDRAARGEVGGRDRPPAHRRGGRAGGRRAGLPEPVRRGSRRWPIVRSSTSRRRRLRDDRAPSRRSASRRARAPAAAPVAVDLERDGSLLVYGASGSGKTTLLRTLAARARRRRRPPSCTSTGSTSRRRGLRGLEALPHCGSVIAGDDEERVGAAVRAASRALRAAAAALRAPRRLQLAEYRRPARASRLPRIVVLLDGYAAFAAAFERVNFGELVDALPRSSRDGRPLGIHFAITADRRGAVPGALAGLDRRAARPADGRRRRLRRARHPAAAFAARRCRRAAGSSRGARAPDRPARRRPRRRGRGGALAAAVDG